MSAGRGACKGLVGIASVMNTRTVLWRLTTEPVQRGIRADLIHPAIPVSGGVHSRMTRSMGLGCRVWASDFGLFLQPQRPGTASKGAG